MKSRRSTLDTLMHTARESISLCTISIVLFAQAIPAQMMAGCGPGSTQFDVRYDSNNGQSGNFFDVEATGGVDVILENMAINVDAGSWSVQVWTRPGTYVGFTGSSAGWTQIIAEMVTGVGLNLATPLATGISQLIPAGQRVGFMVYISNGTSINYTNGTAVGAVSASDASLTVYQGQGVGSPGFGGGLFTTRNWNGTLCYTTGCSGACSNPLPMMLTTTGMTPTQSATGTLVVDSTVCMVDDVTISCQPVAGDEVVVRFTAPFSGSARIDTCAPGTAFDTALAIFDTSCMGMELACNDDSCGGSSAVTLDLVSGTDYAIVVEGAMAATGQAEVTVYLSEGITCSASVPVGTLSTDIPVTVDLDAPAGSVADLDFDFSVDAGVTWLSATAAPGSALANPAMGVAAPSTGNIFTWDSLGDMVGLGAIETVEVRITVTDSVTTGVMTCRTLPFDVMNQLCGGICGDCDGNGIGPNIADALVAAQIATGIFSPSISQAACCDVDAPMPGGTPVVEILDAMTIARISALLPATPMCP